MSKVIKAREIAIPEGMAEILDGKAGRPAGELRNLLAESGKLHTLDREMLQICLGLQIRGIMEATELPGKPMSLRRFSEMMWVTTLTYITGTLAFDENNDLQVGEMNDIKLFVDLMQADEFEFRGGKRIPAEALMAVVKQLTAEEQMKSIYDDISRKGLLKSKRLATGDAMKLAELVLNVADGLPDAKIWD